MDPIIETPTDSPGPETNHLLYKGTAGLQPKQDFALPKMTDWCALVHRHALTDSSAVTGSRSSLLEPRRFREASKGLSKVRKEQVANQESKKGDYLGCTPQLGRVIPRQSVDSRNLQAEWGEEIKSRSFSHETFPISIVIKVF